MIATFPYWLVPFGMMGYPFLWALLELLRTPGKKDRHGSRERDARAV